MQRQIAILLLSISSFMSFAGIPTSKGNQDEAKWISGRTQQGSGGMETFVPRRNPIVARSFCVAKPLSRAMVRIASLGFYDVSVNDLGVTSTAISQWTQYRERILADTYDITGLLTGATNRIEIALGNGWRNPYPLENFGLRMRRTLAVGDPCVKVWLRLEYTDGGSATIVSDPSWISAEGNIVYNSVRYLQNLRIKECLTFV